MSQPSVYSIRVYSYGDHAEVQASIWRMGPGRSHAQKWRLVRTSMPASAAEDPRRVLRVVLEALIEG